MKTKKNYIKPDICEYNVVLSAMICQSAISASTGAPDDYVDENDALGNKNRNSWDDMWSYM